MCLRINFRERFFKLFRGEANPVPISGQRMCTRRLNMRANTFTLKIFSENIQIVHSGFATGNYRDICSRFNSKRGKLRCIYNRVPLCMPAFLHIAPHTAHVAAGKANKISGGTCKSSLALDGIKLFHHRKFDTCYNFFLR